MNRVEENAQQWARRVGAIEEGQRVQQGLTIRIPPVPIVYAAFATPITLSLWPITLRCRRSVVDLVKSQRGVEPAGKLRRKNDFEKETVRTHYTRLAKIAVKKLWHGFTRNVLRLNHKVHICVTDFLPLQCHLYCVDRI